MNVSERLRQVLDREAAVLNAQAEGRKTARRKKTPQARALEALGYERWAMRLGPRTFKYPFSPFHHRFWRWYWPARMKLLAGERLTPDELTALLIWGRGLGKSSHVEWACIAEGALSEGLTDPVMWATSARTPTSPKGTSGRDRAPLRRVGGKGRITG